MMKMSKGGIVLTGFGAFLILSKGIDALKHGVHDISDAIKWKAYCNSKCPEKYIVPPGYSRTMTYKDGTVVYDDPRGRTKREIENSEKSREAAGASGKAVGDAIVDAINSTFKDLKAKEEALQRDLEASDINNESEDADDRSDLEKQRLHDNISAQKTHVEVEGDTDDGASPTIHVVKDEEK